MLNCTMNQAIDVDRKMNIKYKIWWHFSQHDTNILFLFEREDYVEKNNDRIMFVFHLILCMKKKTT
jgi:hypothetical protein